MSWAVFDQTKGFGARLARGLVNRRLVLSRKLPEGAGQALFLATAGVGMLAEHGIWAASGKSIGQTSGQDWTAPVTWKHDLLAHGVLCELFKRGYKVLPEAEIRRRAGSIAKLPDGLVQTPDSQGQWLLAGSRKRSQEWPQHEPAS